VPRLKGSNRKMATEKFKINYEAEK